jgi:hypothetical protein
VTRVVDTNGHPRGSRIVKNRHNRDGAVVGFSQPKHDTPQLGDAVPGQCRRGGPAVVGGLDHRPPRHAHLGGIALARQCIRFEDVIRTDSNLSE